MEKYNTKQKEKIWEMIVSMPSHFTLEDLFTMLKDKQVGKTTIYRYLKELTEKGILKKYSLEGSPACFEYIRDDKDLYHLKCLKCEQIFHLSCNDVEKMVKHIEMTHHFQVDYSKLLFYGICANCQEGKK